MAKKQSKSGSGYPATKAPGLDELGGTKKHRMVPPPKVPASVK